MCIHVRRLLLALTKPFIFHRLEKYQAKIPLDPTLRTFSHPVGEQNITRFCFGTGSSDALLHLKKRCKEEKVTVHGPVVVAVTLAMAKASLGKNLASTPIFKTVFDVDFNMRSRVSDPLERTVGFNVALSALRGYESHGIDLRRPFWDIAREAKRETDKSMQAGIHFQLPIAYIHHNMHSERFVPPPTDKSCASDINFSNIGRYPYQTTYPFQVSESKPSQNATLRRFYVVNNLPLLGPSACFYLTTVDHLNYTLAHKTTDGLGKKLFQYYMKLVENIGTIGRDETAHQVAERLLKDI